MQESFHLRWRQLAFYFGAQRLMKVDGRQIVLDDRALPRDCYLSRQQLVPWTVSVSGLGMNRNRACALRFSQEFVEALHPVDHPLHCEFGVHFVSSHHAHLAGTFRLLE